MAESGMTYLLPHQADSCSFQASLKHMPRATCASWQLPLSPAFQLTFCPSSSSQSRGSSAGSTKHQVEKLQKKKN